MFMQTSFLYDENSRVREPDFAKIKEVQEDPFQIKDFLGQLNANGNIPMKLAHWQMTAKNDFIQTLVEKAKD